MLCKLQVAQLRDVVDAIRAKGAELYAIGNGNALAAKDFKEEQKLNFTLLTDPSLATFQAAGFKSGIASTFGIKTLKSAVGAFRGGFSQSKTQGHAMQQGGALIFTPGDKELYRYISKEAGDHPDPQELVKALG
jgi:AhpC/TSA antioxidant enzyme